MGSIEYLACKWPHTSNLDQTTTWILLPYTSGIILRAVPGFLHNSPWRNQWYISWRFGKLDFSRIKSVSATTRCTDMCLRFCCDWYPEREYKSFNRYYGDRLACIYTSFCLRRCMYRHCMGCADSCSAIENHVWMHFRQIFTVINPHFYSMGDRTQPPSLPQPIQF